MYFTFNGISSETYGLRVKSKNRPIMPEMNNKYVEVAGKDGSYDFSDGTIQDRMIDIEVAFIENNVGDLRYRIRQMAKWLFANGQKCRLIFSDEPDLYYFAKINNKIDFEQTITMGEFTLNFRCEPFAYSVEIAKDAYDLNSPTILYRDLTANDQFVFTGSELANGQVLTVNNWGTADVAPTLLITSPSLNNLEISLWNEAGTQPVSQFYIKNIPAGNTTFTVDMDNYMLYRTNTGENRLNLAFGEWWKLSSGINKVYVNGFNGTNNPTAKLEFVFNARFI